MVVYLNQKASMLCCLLIFILIYVQEAVIAVLFNL